MDGRIDLLGVALQVVGDLVLGGEAIGRAAEFQAGEAVMPGRAIGDQRIPARAAPVLRNAVALQHHMLHTVPAQVLAHGDAGLTGADDQRDGFLLHHCLLACFPGTSDGLLTVPLDHWLAQQIELQRLIRSRLWAGSVFCETMFFVVAGE